MIMDRPVAAVLGSSLDNHYHWTAEGLSRLQVLRQHFGGKLGAARGGLGNSSEVLLMVPDLPNVNASLELLGFDLNSSGLLFYRPGNNR